MLSVGDDCFSRIEFQGSDGPLGSMERVALAAAGHRRVTTLCGPPRLSALAMWNDEQLPLVGGYGARLMLVTLPSRIGAINRYKYMWALIALSNSPKLRNFQYAAPKPGTMC